MNFFLKFILIALCSTFYFKTAKAQSISNDGSLTFPELPKVKMKGEVNTDLTSKKKSRSSEGLLGFWISCKLSREVDNGLFGTWVTRDIPRTLYLWIPLKKNNPFRYVATAGYTLVDQYTVGYNKKENRRANRVLGYTLSLSKDVKFEQKRGYSINGEDILKNKLQEQLDIRGLYAASAPAVSSKSKNLEFFGFKSSELEPSEVSKLSTEVIFSTTSSGPEIPGFVKDYNIIGKKVTYTLGVSDGIKQPIDIGPYIDYDDHKNDSDFCYKYNEGYSYKPSIEHYIAHLFYVKNTEGHFVNDKHYDVAFFDNYTQKFPDVLKVNDGLSKSYEAITKDFLGNQVRNIRIKELMLRSPYFSYLYDRLFLQDGQSED